MDLEKRHHSNEISNRLDKSFRLVYTNLMTSQNYYKANKPRKVLDFIPSDSTKRKMAIARQLKREGQSLAQIGKVLNVSRHYVRRLTEYEVEGVSDL